MTTIPRYLELQELRSDCESAITRLDAIWQDWAQRLDTAKDHLHHGRDLAAAVILQRLQQDIHELDAVFPILQEVAR